MITGTNHCLRRCGELSIKLLIRVVRRPAHKPRPESFFFLKTETVGTFFSATLLVYLIKTHALLNELCDRWWGIRSVFCCFSPLTVVKAFVNAATPVPGDAWEMGGMLKEWQLGIAAVRDFCCYGCLVTMLCPTLCEPVDCSPPGSSVRGILQATILEWVAISFSRGSSWSRDQTCIIREAWRILKP